MRIVAASAIALTLCAPAFGERIKPSGQGVTTPIFAPQHATAPIISNNLKATTTTTGIDVDGHGYVCRTMALRREDGGITKVRRCAD
jgi:hypothetical protein